MLIRHRVLLASALAAPMLLGAQEPDGVTRDPTAAELQICRHYGREDRCGNLATEFHLNHLLSRDVPSAAPLEPYANGPRFTASLRKYALLALLDQGKEDAKQKLAQAISTYGAVNQTGGSPSSAGSTNLASKPTTTDFLSLAAESGAFTDTLNGTATTLQANANGLAKYLTNKPVFQVDGRNWSEALQPLTLAISLNVAQNSTASSVPTSGSATSAALAIASVLIPSNNASFSSFQASYAFYRPYRPTSAKTDALLSKTLNDNQAAFDTSSSAVAASLNALEPSIRSSPAIASARASWLAAGHAAELANDFDALCHAYAIYYDAYLKALSADPAFHQNALNLDVAAQAFAATAQTVMSQVRGTPLATASYTFATPASQPSNHQFTLVTSYLFKGGYKSDPADKPTRTFLSGAELTGNFNVSLYSTIPSAAVYGRLRDVQLSSEFDKPVGGTTDAPRAFVSIAGYGQYQYDPTVLHITAGNLAPGTNISLPSDAQVLLGTAGWIGVVQGKLVINLKPGLSLPIAVKWSNKTDLLPSSDVRGQIGLSYDLSALSRLLSPGK